MAEGTCCSARKLRRKRLCSFLLFTEGSTVSKFHLQRHQHTMKGYQWCFRVKCLHKTCFSTTKKSSDHEKFWFLCFREIFQRASIERALHLPNKVLSPQTLKVICWHFQVLHHSQDHVKTGWEWSQCWQCWKKDPDRIFWDKRECYWSLQNRTLESSHWREWSVERDLGEALTVWGLYRLDKLLETLTTSLWLHSLPAAILPHTWARDQW